MKNLIHNNRLQDRGLPNKDLELFELNHNVYYKNIRVYNFCWICFRPQVRKRETPTLLGPLETGNIITGAKTQ
jgi:hypothetical protein